MDVGNRADQDVVRFYISVHDLTLPHKGESEEHLRSIRPNSTKIDADVLAKSLNNFAQVHAGANL